MPSRMVSLVLVATVVSGCGSTLPPAPPPPPEVTTVTPHPIPPDGRCGELTMLGTQAEITQSPREDEAAERLALRATDAMVAPEARYQRIHADLKAIRAAFPTPGASGVFPTFATTALFLELRPGISQAMAAGTYRGFDCLHAWYGAKRVKPLTLIDMVIVYFKARYHPGHITAAYRAHPDVLSAGGDSAYGGGDDILFCNASFGGTHRYLFQRGWGDCPSGCINYQYRGYSVTEGGEASRLSVEELGEPLPGGVTEGCAPPRR